MNITPVFNQVLASHNAQPVEPYVFRVENLDEFLKEAYRIRRHITKLHTDLKSIRQSYLSTAPPPRRKQFARANNAADKDSKYLTDAQRNEIDAQAKQSLRELNHAINVLREAEGIRQSTVSQVAIRKRAKQGLGALGRWAAGGAITAKSTEEELEEAKANTIKAHRESIVWSLQNALEQCGQFQSSMMEIRLMREVEKSKSVLYKTRATMPSSEYGGTKGGSSADGASKDYRGTTSHGQDESSAAIEQQLDPEQLQLFAQENQDMLKQYEDQLDKVRAAEKSLVEVSELQSTLASNLEMQSAHIEQLVEDSFNTTDNVGSGNKELKRATERRSTAQMVFYGTSAFCTVLVLWDFFI
ncbi:snare-complex protein syntaxin-18 N-terminus-domain-containing protein [Boeremia exigua]|uniref:snare-complex protein syntaxin-18 N-terminus-domain-containing protein n=1 Tax=Boeremia exigua TaxID=749465 RepID=UPI001E8EA5E9|nr:snare-complex protein syntaxin-18 N-terminus-domain-containing protein [Boeremia exigua]KAH6611962.1 snare-complex protein syntaxin-18 N-terminus-domain-containing protein [Boeremia exigua]